MVAVPRDQLLIVDMHSLLQEPAAFVERIATHLSPVSAPVRQRTTLPTTAP